jgi:acyl-CoA thioester hydrolase
MMVNEATDQAVVSVRHRVDYSETDQMGVVYHARYLVWLEIARTELLRANGSSYRELESAGYRMMVSEASLKYRRPARYDDPVRIRCWVRELASRRVSFGYAIEHDETGALLVTAITALLVLDSSFVVTRLPGHLARRLTVSPDLVRL